MIDSHLAAWAQPPATTTPRRRRLVVSFLAATLVATTSFAALADQVEGDVVGPETVSVSATVGVPLSKTVDLYLKRNGQAASSVAWSGPVSEGACGGLTATAASPATLVMPASWAGASPHTLSSASPHNAKSTATISGTPNAAGTCTIKYTGAGNTSNALSPGHRDLAITITVAAPANAAPRLALPADIGPLEGDTLGGRHVSYTVSVIDAEEPGLAATCSPASGALFPVGTTTVSCSVTDAGGLSASGTFDVTVVDTTPPTISGTPVSVTAEATSALGASVTWTAPTAADIVDGAVTVNCVPGPGQFALGVTPVACSATDASRNTARSSFDVTVRDTTPPVIAQPDDVEATATGASGAVVNYPLPTATDAVDPDPAVSCLPAPGSTFPIGSTTVTCNATDASMNAAVARTFKVTVSYGFGGFQAPLNALPTRNVVKAGRAVPVKFELGGDMGMAIFKNSSTTSVGSPVSSNVSCSPSELDPVEVTMSAGSSSLSYDANTKTYNYVWKTEAAWAGQCRTFWLNLADGSAHRITFQFTK